MDTQSLVSALSAEIETLTQVRRLLTGSSSHKPGRKPATATSFPFGVKPRKKRVMSAAARKKIADAQKARWAIWHKQKAAKKTAAKAAA
jgi:hypothetical protein